MHKLKAWAIRKKLFLKKAVGRAIRRMAQTAAIGIMVSIDLIETVNVRAVLYVAAVTAVACLLHSVYEYGKVERE